MVMGEQGKTAIVYNSAHTGHRPVTSSPENPERLTSVIEYLKTQAKVFDNNCILISEFPSASEMELLMVHEKKYIDFIKSYCEKGGGDLGDSTYLTRDSYKYALLAVGGAVKAADLILEKRYANSFALVRPPGHHASADSFGGFCIFNNAAIVARHLQKRRFKEKIMIIDWDVHAANGTMKIFYEDPTVMTISLHRDPVNFYPHYGFPAQIGAREGRGTNINMVLPKTSGDREYMMAIREVVLPLYRIFNPDFVIGCNGFDAHYSDQYSNMKMTATGYYDLVSVLKEEIEDNFMLLMEGGYTNHNGKLAHAIIAALNRGANPYPKEIDVRSDSLFKEGTPKSTMEKNINDVKTALYGIYTF
jgi:acetoin utilization deacetylase AcuC-like enzyme